MNYTIGYFAFVAKAFMEPMRKIGMFVTEHAKAPEVCLVEAKDGLDVLRAQLVKLAHETDAQLFMLEKSWKVPSEPHDEGDLHKLVWLMAVEADNVKFTAALRDAIDASRVTARKATPKTVH